MNPRIEKLYANRDRGYSKWRETVEAIGIDATLDALGFSRDRNALWYNQYTGSTETLHTLITETSCGTVKVADQTHNFAIVLEHWLPQQGDSNPIMERAKSLTEHQVKTRVGENLKRYILGTPTVEAFIDRVKDQGATFEDGSYMLSPKTRANVRVLLHDDRVFMFPLRSIYQLIKSSSEQPALFEI